MNKKQKKMLKRIIICIIMLTILHFIPVQGSIKLLLYLLPYLVISYDIIIKAIKGIINLKPFDESLLMTIATLGAIALGIYKQMHGLNGDFLEAVAVALFYQIGEFFQSIAVGKSRKNIAQLMDIRPERANIEKDNKIEQIDPNIVDIGSTIVVNPGEKVPIDGIILSGESYINTVALSGESTPKKVEKGDEIISGCVNLEGQLKIKTTKKFADSAVSKILELVENASSKKSKSENFISKFARVYTPAVVFLALALAIFPPLFRLYFLNIPAIWSEWIYRALTFLVISCPCALVISIPLSFFAGIGKASAKGILIKGSNYLETLSKVKTVVFDKTGTLTQGEFKVNAIHHNKINEEKLLEYAALAENASSHPIAQSIKNAYKKEIKLSRVSNIQELSGLGVIATIDDKEIMAGSEKLMAKYDIEAIKCHSTGTIIHIAINREYMGHIVISDIIKPESKPAIDSLKKLNIKNIIMLSGDLKKIAEYTAHTLGIDKVYSELMPDGKVKKMEEIINNKTSSVFVGDGINDAPVLAIADIGIAMGAMGSDAAIEAADVVLMDDNPKKIADAIKLSKNCLNIVKQNIVFALGVKFICLILGALGIANMWFAVFADVGVMIICILNAIKLLIEKPLKTKY